MAGFDMFVLPSLYEGFPFAILEAMAAGLPCVASNVDGVGEAILNGQTGWLCPPNAGDLWLARIRSYIDDDAARAVRKSGSSPSSRSLQPRRHGARQPKSIMGFCARNVGRSATERPVSAGRDRSA